MAYDPDDPSGFNTEVKDDTIAEKIRDYWERRSRGYNLLTSSKLKNSDWIRHQIAKNLPHSGKCSICDMGTGCGLVAIVAARMGHEVTAIDYVTGMIENARKNAESEGLDINFIECSVESVDLEPQSFDLIIAKNTVSYLSSPVKTLSRWTRFLKNNGRLLIIDGNYYLHFHDADYAKKHKLDELRNTIEGGEYSKYNIDNVDFSEIRELAKLLPTSSLRRPSWDLSVMIGLGYDDIKVETMKQDQYCVASSSGYMIIPYYFLINGRLSNHDFLKIEENALEPIATNEDNENLLKIFKILGNDNRYGIVMTLMNNGKTNVKSIASTVESSISLVTHDLKILEKGGIIRSEKHGRETFYSLVNPHNLMDLLYYSKLMGCPFSGDRDFE